MVCILAATASLGMANAEPRDYRESNKAANLILERETKAILSYVVPKQGGKARFDEARARRDGIAAHYLELGRMFNDYAGSANGGAPLPQPGYQVKVSLPVYGNWCGPGHGGGTPIDALDQACMHHDKCYQARGYFRCSCDQQLIDEINRNYYKMRYGKERNMAAVIKAYFTVQKLWCRK